MAQVKDQAIIYVTNWLIMNKESFKDEINSLKNMNSENRMNDKTFLNMVEKIKNHFYNGNLIQKNIFCFIDNFDFKQIVNELVENVDSIYEMSKNFEQLCSFNI